jgi:hypothetical protein
MEKIKANAIIEIVGTPKEHIEQTMQKVVNLIEGNEDHEIITKEIHEPKESEFPDPMDKEKKIKVWSTFTELEANFKSFDALTNFCFEFMPSSIEIIEPLELKIDAQEINNTLNDILARLHQQSKIMMEYATLKRKIQEAAAKHAEAKNQDPS